MTVRVWLRSDGREVLPGYADERRLVDEDDVYWVCTGQHNDVVHFPKAAYTMTEPAERNERGETLPEFFERLDAEDEERATGRWSERHPSEQIIPEPSLFGDEHRCAAMDPGTRWNLGRCVLYRGHGGAHRAEGAATGERFEATWTDADTELRATFSGLFGEAHN